MFFYTLLGFLFVVTKANTKVSIIKHMVVHHWKLVIYTKMVMHKKSKAKSCKRFSESSFVCAH